MDLSAKKTILRKIPSGLFIVTAKDGEQGAATVISFATQISFDPTLIALAIRKDSGFYSIAKSNDHLAVHIPGKDQQAMVASFFKLKERAGKAINRFEFEWSDLNIPLLKDIPMILEVKVSEVIEKGDHPVFICEVVNAILREDVEALTMVDTNWHYGG